MRRLSIFLIIIVIVFTGCPEWFTSPVADKPTDPPAPAPTPTAVPSTIQTNAFDAIGEIYLKIYLTELFGASLPPQITHEASGGATTYTIMDFPYSSVEPDATASGTYIVTEASDSDKHDVDLTINNADSGLNSIQMTATWYAAHPIPMGTIVVNGYSMQALYCFMHMMEKLPVYGYAMSLQLILQMLEGNREGLQVEYDLLSATGTFTEYKYMEEAYPGSKATVSGTITITNDFASMKTNFYGELDYDEDALGLDTVVPDINAPIGGLPETGTISINNGKPQSIEGLLDVGDFITGPVEFPGPQDINEYGYIVNAAIQELLPPPAFPPGTDIELEQDLSQISEGIQKFIYTLTNYSIFIENLEFTVSGNYTITLNSEALSIDITEDLSFSADPAGLTSIELKANGTITQFPFEALPKLENGSIRINDEPPRDISVYIEYLAYSGY